MAWKSCAFPSCWKSLFSALSFFILRVVSLRPSNHSHPFLLDRIHLDPVVSWIFLLCYGSHQRSQKGSVPSVSFKVQEVGHGIGYVERKEDECDDEETGSNEASLVIGFSSSKRPAVQIGVKLLLDDSIYHGNCPPEVKKHLFVYEVIQLHENGKTAQVKYLDQVVKGVETGLRYTRRVMTFRQVMVYVLGFLFFCCFSPSFFSFHPFCH